MSSVVHIVPQLPPAVDGVGDYCWNLWRHWPEPSLEWKFVVARGAEATAEHWPEVCVREFGQAREELGTALEKARCATAVLHYVGYGFQPKGIPLSLPGALAVWKQANPTRRLVTMFHEMYARSSPLRSPFWVAPLARRIIRHLVRISDSWVTSCERYFAQLTGDFGARPELGRAIPIGSNIALAAEPNISVRTRAAGEGLRFVVFGLARTRIWALESHWKLLRALQAAGALHSVTLLGKPYGSQDEKTWQGLKHKVGADVRWNLRFDLGAAEISRELLAHDFGLLANEPDTLMKSGVFAAFATHGVIPLISQRKATPVTPPLAHAVMLDDGSGDTSDWRQLISDPARLKLRRERLSTFAARELSWRRITGSWRDLLEPSAGNEACGFSMAQAKEAGRAFDENTPALTDP
jgi:hypothetical protein